MVKNAVIVPVGAKGGFVVKGASADPAARDAVRDEGVDRYRRFVGALLAITDNVVDGDVVPPPGCVVYDEPDPYLVVAADKGTSSFSDIANELAAAHGFWLGDAFASGGSQGYDHKEMGITARGAWESVRRHARVLGLDADTDPITMVGIGDMSGDVFGNGLLRSPNVRLVAAFDHRHIFLDPDPDAPASYAERRRLFDLPQSSWADYDPSLISAGGGVHARSVKSIAVTPEVRAALGLDPEVTSMRPDELITAVLCAPVDLLWNGGIGTYVKSIAETNEMVGDRVNDPLRVDGAKLRCRMAAEGGNLGFTQLGRVEYALAGGLIYTDAIDNSAGVDCSDHEVNIKIALDQLVGDGELTTKQRNALLVEMTDDVAELVLDNNRAQTLALMIARHQSLPMVNVHARYLDSLEAEGILDRELEFLPTDKQIAERQSLGSGLRAPEFAVMIAYTKSADVAEVLETDLPDDPALEAELLAYFPAPLQQRFPDTLRAHRLRREIITTSIVNTMVNLAGISYDHRMTEDTGATVSDVLRAFLAARRIIGLDADWASIEAIDSSVPLDIQIGVFLESRRWAERASGWLLRHRPPTFGIDATVAEFAAPIAEIESKLDAVVTSRVAADIELRRTRRLDAGVPEALATRAARWPWMHPGFDIAELATQVGCPIERALTAYWSVFDAFDVFWLWEAIGALPRSDRWQTQARSALRDDLLTVVASLARQVLTSADGSTAEWVATNARVIGKAMGMHTEIRRAESFDLTTLSVALRQLRNVTMAAR
jgi:glutamate dehydrogenase